MGSIQQSGTGSSGVSDFTSTITQSLPTLPVLVQSLEASGTFEPFFIPDPGFFDVPVDSNLQLADIVIPANLQKFVVSVPVDGQYFDILPPATGQTYSITGDPLSEYTVSIEETDKNEVSI